MQVTVNESNLGIEATITEDLVEVELSVIEEPIELRLEISGDLATYQPGAFIELKDGVFSLTQAAIDLLTLAGSALQSHQNISHLASKSYVDNSIPTVPTSLSDFGVSQSPLQLTQMENAINALGALANKSSVGNSDIQSNAISVDKLDSSVLDLFKEKPALVGNVTTDPEINLITLAGSNIGTSLKLNVGDVIELTYLGNSQLYTVNYVASSVETLVLDDTTTKVLPSGSIIVNFEHSELRGNSVKKLPAITDSEVVITKAYTAQTAPLLAGLGWVNLFENREMFVEYINDTERFIIVKLIEEDLSDISDYVLVPPGGSFGYGDDIVGVEEFR